MPWVKQRVLKRLDKVSCAVIGQVGLRLLRIKKKRKRMKEWIGRREKLGASTSLLRELAAEDASRNVIVLRMELSKWEELLEMITDSDYYYYYSFLSTKTKENNVAAK